MFGENMKAIMKQKKITSRTLAPAIGISETYVSYLLNGKKSPTFKLVEKIAAYLGVPIEALITKKEPPPTDELEALAKKYQSVLLAMESMRPELVAEITERIEAAASLFPRKDASENRSQGGASYLRRKKPG